MEKSNYIPEFKNDCEKDIFNLFTWLYSIQQVKNELKITHYCIQNIEYFIAQLLLLKLLSYTNSEKSKNKKEYNYTKSKRNYTNKAIEEFKKFHTKYNHLRNKFIAHYDKDFNKNYTILYNDLNRIINIIFLRKIHFIDKDVKVMTELILNVFKYCNNQNLKPFILLMNKDNYKNYKHNENIIINLNDIIEI